MDRWMDVPSISLASINILTNTKWLVMQEHQHTRIKSQKNFAVVQGGIKHYSNRMFLLFRPRAENGYQFLFIYMQIMEKCRYSTLSPAVNNKLLAWLSGKKPNSIFLLDSKLCERVGRQHVPTLFCTKLYHTLGLPHFECKEIAIVCYLTKIIQQASQIIGKGEAFHGLF